MLKILFSSSIGLLSVATVLGAVLTVVVWAVIWLRKGR
jgi:hypothetical protein